MITPAEIARLKELQSEITELLEQLAPHTKARRSGQLLTEVAVLVPKLIEKVERLEKDVSLTKTEREIARHHESVYRKALQHIATSHPVNDEPLAEAHCQTAHKALMEINTASTQSKGGE